LLRRLRDHLPRCVLPPGFALADKLLPSRGKLVGQQVGPYRLRQVVAAGGFGTIYLGETAQGERVAVKVLESDDAVRQFGRFTREFAKLESANHPGIIACYQRGRQLIDGQVYPWYSMEFAVGGDLSMRIDDRGPSPWQDSVRQAEIADEFRQVAVAVAHLHHLGIVHRDIKPSNVLIVADGGLRLSDFGLVKNLNPSTHTLRDATSTGAVLGTPDYMAPEQKKGLEVDATTDVYALGVLLAELATGHRPRANTEAGQGSTLNNEEVLRDLPERLRRLILRCTDVLPSNRPADARHLLEQFSEAMAAAGTDKREATGETKESLTGTPGAGS
jgi:serine/threonine protein kinase